jgi:hypothetical protein
VPLELVLTCPGQIFPAIEEKSFVLLGWISSNGTRPEPRSNSAPIHRDFVRKLCALAHSRVGATLVAQTSPTSIPSS